MSMNRNDALAQLIRQQKFNLITAKQVLDADGVPASFHKALDAKDIAFFLENSKSPASSVAIGCMLGRVFPPKVPSPNAIEISQKRKELGLSQTAAASLIYSTLRTWQDWEADVAKMHPGLWELFCKKTCG